MYPTVQEPPCQVHAVHVTIVMNTALLHVLAPLMSITALYRFWHVLQLKILVFLLTVFLQLPQLKMYVDNDSSNSQQLPLQQTKPSAWARQGQNKCISNHQNHAETGSANNTLGLVSYVHTQHFCLVLLFLCFILSSL